MFRLVAATRRKSTLRALTEPTRQTLRLSSTRRSLAWISGGISPISSRKRVPCRQFDLADFAVLMRAGKRAARIAEQLGLKEILGDGRAVDADKRTGGAVAAHVQGVRRQLLARAGPAQNQHGMGVGGIVLDEFFHRPHGRAVADDASNIVMGVVFRLEAAVVMLQLFCQEIDFAVQLAQFRRIREKNMRNHAP